MTEMPPFTGEYPTVAEAEHALADLGFAEHFDTIVTIPMDGSSGPLAEELTRCKSAHLTQQWPHMFKAIVGSMLKQADRR